MPKYNADGDVIDISLQTIKVRNWDKTITSIPIYALVSDSFKNWRGMTESGGRRIMRSIHIDMKSIRLCDAAMLERFRKIHYIKDYISAKEEELARYNAERGIDDSVKVNGRRLTNIGTFRAYMTSYLRHHPGLRQDMTLMVRQLDPGPKGVPLQVWTFTATTAWVDYEGIQSDIFDHLLSVLPEFDLRAFQEPSGWDMERIGMGCGGPGSA
jgi:miniconductance mechanosensitive channel